MKATNAMAPFVGVPIKAEEATPAPAPTPQLAAQQAAPHPTAQAAPHPLDIPRTLMSDAERRAEALRRHESLIRANFDRLREQQLQFLHSQKLWLATKGQVRWIGLDWNVMSFLREEF